MKEEIKSLESQISEIFTKSKEMVISYMEKHKLTSVDLCTDFKGVSILDTDNLDEEGENEYYDNRIFVTAYDVDYVTASAVLSSVKLIKGEDGNNIIITADDEVTSYDNENIETNANVYLDLLKWLIKRFGE